VTWNACVSFLRLLIFNFVIFNDRSYQPFCARVPPRTTDFVLDNLAMDEPSVL